MTEPSHSTQRPCRAAPDFLFIRLLEACNADCFMCHYAMSNDRYRLGLDELAQMLPGMQRDGIRFVRFTGGEPLLHRDIVPMIALLSGHGFKSSIITNGSTLARKAQALAEAGLGQVVVSIDGLAETHDRLRGTPGLFALAMAGLRRCGEHNIALRVNSVVGPENFRELPALQALFTEIGVAQWEMSSLKMGGALGYAPGDRDVIERDIIPAMFGHDDGRLVPLGKIWCGDTKEERDRYFATGITPRPDGRCHIVDRVRFFDAKNGRLYACDMIPHRRECQTTFPATAQTDASFSVAGPDIGAQVEHFHRQGPGVCTGCSTTASGVSNAIGRGEALAEWWF